MNVRRLRTSFGMAGLFCALFAAACSSDTTPSSPRVEAGTAPDAGAVPDSSATPADAGDPACDAFAERLQTGLDGERTKQKVKHASLGVWTERCGTRIVVSSTGGQPPVTPDALWKIGSETKMFTSVAILRLIELGKFQLDDPIDKWFPAFPRASTLTVRHLLNHTSGIANYTELKKFSDLAAKWWDPTSEFKPLHEINPLRLEWIDRTARLGGKRVLDVGCGGGILAEGMAKKGAQVTGIDLAEKSLKVAMLHRLESGLAIDYEQVAVEELAARAPASFDVVTCMEMLEHVPDPASVVRACGALVKPGGTVFFSTLNRNPKSFLFAIVGAEYVLRLLPRGTHEYARFIRPSELARACREAGLALHTSRGLEYNPITRRYWLSADTSVNYLVACRRPT